MSNNKNYKTIRFYKALTTILLKIDASFAGSILALFVCLFISDKFWYGPQVFAGFTPLSKEILKSFKFFRVKTLFWIQACVNFRLAHFHRNQQHFAIIIHYQYTYFWDWNDKNNFRMLMLRVDLIFKFLYNGLIQIQQCRGMCGGLRHFSGNFNF